MKVYYLLVSALCVWTTPTHSQFFYSHYTPLTQISPFFPQTFLPTLPAASPVAYSIPPSHAAPTSTASVSYNIPASTAEFRGFGYRTDYKDGATSTVFYVTGPEAQQLRNFRDFPNFTRKIEDASAGKARSLASDAVDVNAVPDAVGKIQSILQPSEFQKLFDVMPGVVNFYTFPAGTVPLALARQLNTTTNSTTEENIAAESVVNPKIVINDVENLIKSNGTTEASTVSEEPEVGTTQSAATTETSNSVSVEAKEEKSTTSTEEATTENTTEV